MVEKLSPDPQKGGRTYVPTRTYDLKLVIDDLDYTGDLILVRFVSSLTTAYQSVDFVLEIDPNDIILQQLYGTSVIKLAITLLREDQFPGERIDLDLMFTKGKFQLNEKDSLTEGKQKDRGYYSVSTVVRESYKIMNTLVNDVFIGSNLNSIVNKLATMVGADKVEFDFDGQNTQVIDQVCIPPTTFYKIIKEYNSVAENPFDGFLDQRFGFFDGVPGIFCQYDKRVQIKNLTAKMQKNPAFIIYQISTDMSLTEWDAMLKETANDNTFYTYSTVDTDYAGNAKFAKIGSTIKHIVKPKDTLSQTINQDLKDIAGKYGIIHMNKNIDVDPAALRTRYFIQDTGDETNETIFNSRISRRVADLSTLTIDIERNLPVLNLIKVGECVKFKPKTAEYADLEGKYILWSTDIWFRRKNNWETTAQVKLIRTNKRAGWIVKPKVDVSVLPELAQEERALQRASRHSNVSRSTVEVVNEAGQTETQQVTQRTGEIAKPYQEKSGAVLSQIEQNQNEINQLTEEQRRCEIRGVSTGVCSTNATSKRRQRIRSLRQRNIDLAG
jgi:hypothetical protein